MAAVIGILLLNGQHPFLSKRYTVDFESMKKKILQGFPGIDNNAKYNLSE
jgi:hypothetical protein